MSDLRTAAQQALEALEHHGGNLPWNAFVEVRKDLRDALAQQKDPTDPGNDVNVLREHVRHLERRIRELHAQQAEPLNLSDPAVQKRLATQWGYVPAAQAEPVEPVAWMFESERNFNLVGYGGWEKRITECRPNALQNSVRNVTPLYTAPPQRTMVPLTEKEMYAVDEEARKNFRLSQKGPRGQQITYWDGLTPWLIRAVERAHGIKEN